MNKDTQEIISKLIKTIDSYQPNNKLDEDQTTEYSKLTNILQYDNPLHASISKSLNFNLIKDIHIKNESLRDKQTKIKYKSQVNIEDLDQIVNFSLWKNAPTVNLFNAYESKKSNFIYEESKKTSNTYNTANNIKKKKENFEDDDGDTGNTGNSGATGNTYMSNQNGSTNEIDYDTYTNSIYNVNKKRNNKKPNNNNWKNKNKHEEEEEDNDSDYEKKCKINLNNKTDNNENEIGFKSAINVINKKVFNNKNTSRHRDTECNEHDDNFLENAKKINTTNNQKFVPPNKNNKSNISTDKQTVIDEKLKGFDPKLIEFIESEILSFCPDVKWEDIAGLEFAKKTIREIIIWPLLRPDLFYGIRRPPKGMLLFGPPGTGKTMIAKAIASESKSKFFNISASSLMSKWIGDSEKLVRTLFALASYYQPSVVFIDEIDSILTARSENECEASRRLKTEFLVQLDGAGTNQDDRILIIGATNRPQEIDDAFIRRLSKRLYIPLPNFGSRKQLVETVVNKEIEKKSKYDLSESDITSIVKMTKGYSGSDLINVCREAAMMPIRSIEDIFNIQLDNLRGVILKDFQDSITLVKPSVSEKTLEQYVVWNREFGSFQFDEKENDN